MKNFSKKDREDTNLGARLFSITAFAGVYGVSMNTWMKKYRNSSKFFGYNWKGPVSDASRQFQKTIANLFPWMDNELTKQVVSGASFELDKWGAESHSSQQQLVDSIERLTKDANHVMTDYVYNIKNTIGEINNINNRFEKYYKDEAISKTYNSSVIVKRIKAGYDEIKDGIMGVTKGNVVKKWGETINANIDDIKSIDFIKEKIIKKHPSLVTSSFDNLNSLPSSVLQEYKNSIKEFIHYTVSRNNKFRVEMLGVAQIDDVSGAIVKINEISDRLLEFPKYARDIHDIIKPIKLLPTSGIGSSLSDIPVQNFSSDMFYKLIGGKKAKMVKGLFTRADLKDVFPGEYKGTKQMLKGVGYHRPGFGNLLKYYSLIEKGAKNIGANLDNITLSVSDYGRGGSKFVFDVAMSKKGGPSRHVKIPLNLSNKWGIQFDPISPVKVFSQYKTGDINYTNLQYQKLSANISKYFLNLLATDNESLAIKSAEERVQSMVDNGMRDITKACDPATGIDQVDWSRSLNVGPYKETLKSMGLLNGIEKIALPELHKIRSSFMNDSVVTYIDMSRGTLNGVDVINDIGIINTVKGKDGIEIKKAVRFRLTDNAKGTQDFIANISGLTANRDKLKTLKNSAKYDVIPVTKEELIKILPNFLKGQIIGKNVQGDIDAFTKFLGESKTRDVGNILRALQSPLDTQKSMRLNPRANMSLSIEHLIELINDRIKYLDKGDNGNALNMVNKVVGSLYRGTTWSDLYKNKIAHESVLDCLHIILNDSLWAFNDWDLVKNRPKYMDAMEKISPKLKKYISGFVSPNKSYREVGTLMPFDDIFLDIHGRPLNKPLYQFFGSTTSIEVARGNQISWQGLEHDKTGRLVKDGLFSDEMIDKGLRNYIHRANVLIVNPSHHDVYEQQIVPSKNFLARYLVERSSGSALVDTNSIREGGVLPGTHMTVDDSFGTLNGVAQYPKGKGEVIIKRAPSDGAKTRIEYSMIRKVKTGMKVFLQGLTKGVLQDAVDMNYNIDMKIGHDMLKGMGPAEMLSVKLGQISYWAGTDANRKAAVKTAFKNSGLADGGNMILTASTGELVFKMNDFKRGIASNDYNKALNGIVKIMKSIKLTQNYASSSLINTGLLGAKAQNEVFNDITKKAVLSEFLDDMETEGFRSDFIRKAWGLSRKELAIMTGEAKKMVEGSKDYDASVIDRFFSSKNISMYEAYRHVKKGSSKEVIDIGVMVGNVEFAYSQLEPMMGRGGGEMPLNMSFLRILKHQPGSDKLHQGLLKEMQQQNSLLLGQFRRQFLIAEGKLAPDGVDIMQKFNSILKGNEGNELKKVAQKFMAGGWSVAKTANQTFHNIDGVLYNINSPEYAQLPQHLKTNGQFVSEEIIKGKTVPSDIANLFKHIFKDKGTGYVKLPKATFMKVPGTRFGQYTNIVQMYEGPWTDIADGSNSVTSQLMIQQANLIRKAYSDSANAGGFLQQMLDTMGSSKLVENQKFTIPGSCSTLQFGKFSSPYVSGMESILGGYTNESVLDFEVLMSKDWAANNAKMIKDQIMGMETGEMNSVMKYMKNYGGFISGNPNHVGAAHPHWETIKNDIVGKLGDKDMTVDGLFKATTEKNLNSIKGNQIRRLWFNAYVGEKIPMPGLVSRYPTVGGESMPPVMMWIRNSVKGEMIRISSLVGKFMGGDSDGDTTVEGLIPKGIKKYMTTALSERGIYSKQGTKRRLEKFMDKGVAKYLVYNPKLHSSELVDYKSAMVTIKENIINDFTSMNSDFKAYEGTMERMATLSKHWPPVITPIVNRAVVLAESFGMESAEIAPIIDSFGSMIEWGLHHKGKHDLPAVEVGAALQNLGDSEALKYLDDVAKQYPKIGEFYNAELPGSRVKERIEDILGKGTKPIVRNYMRAGESIHPGYWKHGNKATQSFMSGRATLLKAIINNIQQPGGSTALSESVRPFLLDGTNLVMQRPEMTMLQSFKNDMTNKFGETVVKNAGNLGKVASLMALGYMALNVFRPDQMGSLGHMPGTGGEKWDYAFTKPELDWAQLMQTPLGNPSDLPKAYIELFNNRSFENIQKKKYLSLPRMPVFKNEIRQKAYTRNNFSTTSYNIDSVALQEKLQKYGK